MTDKQPEALRLADALDDADQDLLETELALRAACELRRLHEANQAMLSALKLCLDGFEDLSKNHGISYITEIVDARAAIAKGETA